MRKRFFASLLSLCMVIGLLPGAAFAADGGNSGNVAKIGDTEYATLKAAVDAVPENGSAPTTITLLRNVENASGMTIPSGKNFILDFDGHTYTLNKPGAGSLSTETNGFQFLKDSTIVFKNGTINISQDNLTLATSPTKNIMRIIQNYANLTLEDMTIDGTNQYGGASYIMSFNHGPVSITGNTSIIAAEGKVAFDADGNWDGYDRCPVTINTTGTITGDIEVGQGYLTVENANVKGGIVLCTECGEDETTGQAKRISITGGTFSDDVSQYVPNQYAVSEKDGKYVVGALSVENAAARINGTYYKTLAEAVSAAEAGNTVTLLKDCEIGTLVINKNIILDLGTHTLRIVKTDKGKVFGLAFVNNTATVQNGTIIDTRSQNDSSAGWMAVLASNATLTTKNVTMQSYCPTSKSAYNYIIFLQLKASLVLEQGTVIKDIVGSATSENSYGVVGVAMLGPSTTKNYTETTNVTINGGSINTWAYALSGNGTNHGTNITINGGDINSRESGAIYHPQAGKLTMNGGVLTGKTGVQLCSGEATSSTGFTFNGGTVRGTGNDERTSMGTGDGIVSDGAAISLVNRDYPGGAPKITINGGYFASANNDAVIAYTWNNGTESKWENAGDFLKISDGYFTSDPSAYVVDGKAAVPSDKAGYAFMVGDATQSNVKPATGEPDVAVSEKIDSSNKETVNNVAESVNADDGVLGAAANQVVSKVTTEQQTAATNAIKSEKSGVTVNENDTVNIYAQTYLKIEAEAYDSEKNTVTLDITPMYRVVASTATTAEGIKLENSAVGQTDKNAVVLEGSEKELTGIKNIQITVDLPTGFREATGTKCYAEHNHNGSTYYYPLTIKDKADNSGKTATFTNTNGFSLFSLPVEKELAASITVNGQETAFETLQDAVNAVQDGQTITLKKTAEATVPNKTISFKVDCDNNNNVTATIKDYRGNEVKPAEDGFYHITRQSSGSGTTTYAITTNSPANGTVTASPKSAAKGAIVTLTVTPTEGYQLDKLTVLDKDGKEIPLTDKGNGKYTFTMPASKLDVTATFKQAPVTHVCPAEKYTDVDTAQWYHEGVDYVIANGMMNGTGTNIFEPNSTTTRGMIVTILYRLEKEPAAGTSPFTDVDAGQWYAKAVAWAAANGVVNGTSPTTFNPNDPITREQMAAILYRYASFKGYDVTEKADLAGYTDAAQISDYAKDAMSWANQAGLIGGVSATTLQPQGSATRAQVATILMRFCENVAK